MLTVILIIIAPTAIYASCNSITSCDDCIGTIADKGTQLCSWCLSSKRCVNRSSLQCFLARTTANSTCGLSPKSASIYDDAFTRYKMLRLSATAYSDNPQQCLNNAINGTELKRQITVTCDSFRSQTCSAFTAISHDLRAVMLAFRGTEDFVQLATEGETSILEPQITLEGIGKVNAYFYNAFKSVWNAGIRDDLVELIRDNPSYELWITGHSLGASMASIASTFIVKYRIAVDHKIKLVIFGQPRTGDRQYAALHDHLLHFAYRVVHARDIVSHLPPKDFEHYYHHLYEVWYNNKMEAGDPYIICATPESINCSDSLIFHLSVKQHTHYFGIDVKHYGKNECKMES